MNRCGFADPLWHSLLRLPALRENRHRSVIFLHDPIPIAPSGSHPSSCGPRRPVRDLDVRDDVRDGFDASNSFHVADRVSKRTAISGVGTKSGGLQNHTTFGDEFGIWSVSTLHSGYQMLCAFRAAEIYYLFDERIAYERIFKQGLHSVSRIFEPLLLRK